MRSLGYDLPMVEEGEPDPEFEAILNIVDPNRWVTWPGSYNSMDVKHVNNITMFVFAVVFCQGWKRVSAGVHGLHDQPRDGERQVQ